MSVAAFKIRTPLYLAKDTRREIAEAINLHLHAVEALTSILDHFDGDADFEPDADREDGADDEAALGWPEMERQTGIAQSCFGNIFDVDLEMGVGAPQ